ncbi:MAG: cupin domain-containing protein [Nocardioidaceae bacterium]
MTAIDLSEHATDLLETARAAHSGRAAHLLVGGPQSTMTQTIIALREGAVLHEHNNPGEATVYVLDGRVRLSTGGETAEAGRGALLNIAPEPHSLEAVGDSVVLLTSVKLPG